MLDLVEKDKNNYVKMFKQRYRRHMKEANKNFKMTNNLNKIKSRFDTEKEKFIEDIAIKFPKKTLREK